MQLNDSFINACANWKTHICRCVYMRVYVCMGVAIILCVFHRVWFCLGLCVIFYLFTIDDIFGSIHHTFTFGASRVQSRGVWIHVPHFMHIIWRDTAVIVHYSILCSLMLCAYYYCVIVSVFVHLLSSLAISSNFNFVLGDSLGHTLRRCLCSPLRCLWFSR